MKPLITVALVLFAVLLALGPAPDPAQALLNVSPLASPLAEAQTKAMTLPQPVAAREAAQPIEQMATPTPWPGPQATATAAAQRMQQAQADTTAAAELQRQADAKAASARAELEAARADQAAAQAYIAAQQISAASEAIGRIEARIANAYGQIDQVLAISTKQKAIIDAQSATIISLTLELQQARADRQQYATAYAAQAQQNKNDNNGSLVGNIFTITVFAFVVILMAWLIMRVLRRREVNTVTSTPSVIIEPPQPAPLDGEWIDNAAGEGDDYHQNAQNEAQHG